MLAVKVHVDDKQVMNLMRNLPREVVTSVGNANHEFAKIVRNSMRNELLNDRVMSPERNMARKRIRAKRLSKLTSTVNMPMSLYYLDTMRPHGIHLKRGRTRVLSWTRKYFGTQVMFGLSKVYRTNRGRVYGMLYVTPHPFVNTALRKVRRKLPKELKKGLRKAYKRSRR